MTPLRVATAYLDVPAPETVKPGRRPKKIPAHEMTLEIGTSGFRIWDERCDACGEPFMFDAAPHAAYFRPVKDMPHLDEALKATTNAYAANRAGPLGAFMSPAVSAVEDAIAQRDGSSVYFAAAGNRIKIGWSRKVGSRIAQLQTGNPEPVTLLATMPGGVSRERELHRLFAHARLTGEWFDATPNLIEFIRALETLGIPTTPTGTETPA